MLSLNQWLAFITLATFLVLIPGADTALVIRTAIHRGRGTALLTALGICSGLFLWGAATALGLAALFQSSEVAHDLLAIAGSIYLIYLGVKTLKERSNPLEGERPLTGSVFLTGFLANLLNPKVAVFYFSIFAQFITPGANAVWQGLALAGVHFLLSMVWFVILTSLLMKVLADTWRKRITVVSGSVLIVFGISLAVPVISSNASAATVVSSPISTTSYSLGAPENEFASLATTPNGWVLVGTVPAVVANASWALPAGPGGEDVVVATVDAAGKPRWATRVGTANDDAGLVVTSDAQGSIWAVGVTALTTPNPTAVPTALDPDGVGTVIDNEGDTGPNQLLISNLSSDGALLRQTTIPINPGLSIQPVEVFATATGLTIVGSVAADESGLTQGVIVTVDQQLQATFAFVGTSSTTITDAELLPTGIQIVGASAESLGNKTLIGIRDAYTATWSNNALTNVIRSGTKGSDRSWSSFTPTKTGYLFTGWAETAGKSETVLTSLTRTGKVVFTLRYPHSDDQIAFASNRIALTTKTASTAFPGWKPKGVDLLILTLDAKGKTTAIMALAGTGQEELLGLSTKMVLARTSVPLGQAQGPLLLARITR